MNRQFAAGKKPLTSSVFVKRHFKISSSISTKSTPLNPKTAVSDPCQSSEDRFQKQLISAHDFQPGKSNFINVSKSAEYMI